MTLGAASFEFVGQNADLIVKAAQAEAAAKKAYDEIAKSAGLSAASVERASKQMAAAYVQQVDASAAATVKLIKSHNDAADAADKAAQRAAASGKGFADYAKQGLALGTALTGVTVGLASVREGLDATVTATLKADQAARQLSAAYRDQSASFKAYADQQAAAFNLTNTTVETGVARLSILQKQYGITSDEIQKLTRVALNLGTTFGDNAEAIRSVQAAIRGEPEALEKYGIALQENAIRNSNLLTEAERRNFTSLDAISQARIRYRIILAESAQYENAADERAKSAQGGFDKLARATNELEKALGKLLVPGLGQAAGAFSVVIDKVAAFTGEVDKAVAGVIYLHKLVAAPFTGVLPEPPGASQPTQETGQFHGPSVADVKAINDRFEAEARRHEDQQVEILIAGLKRSADARKKDLDEQRQVLEREQARRLKGIDDERDARLAEIKETADASKKASDDRIAHLEVDQEAEKRASSDRRDAATASLEAEAKAVAKAAEAQITSLEITRDAAKQAAGDKRDAAIRAIDDEQRAAQRASEQQRALIEQDKQQAIRAAEDTKTSTLRGIDDEEKATARKFERRIALAEQAKDREKRAAEDVRDAALAAIAAETKALGLTRDQQDHTRGDTQESLLRGIDAGRDATSRTRELEDRGRDAAQEILLRRLASEHDATVRGFDAERTAADRMSADRLAALDRERDAADAASAARLAGFDREREAVDAVHKAAVEGFGAEAAAARDANADRLRQISDQLDLAERAHDAAIRGIDDQRRAEDDRSRTTLANIDAEQRRREAAIDAQLRALDAADKVMQQAAQRQQAEDKIASAQFGLLRARSSGNQSTIDAAARDLAAAQQSLADQQTRIVRDAARDQLADQKQALTEEVRAARDAEEERSRLRKAALDADKRAADDVLKAARDTADGQKSAAADVLAATLDGIDRRSKAEQKAYDEQTARIAAAKTAEQVAHAATLTSIDERRKAEQAAHAAIVADIDARRQKEADTYADTVQKTKDAYAAQTIVIADRRRAEDVALAAYIQRVKDTYAEETRRLQDARRIEDDELAKKKLAVSATYDDEIRKLAQTYDDPVSGVLAKLRQQASDARDRYGDRKRDVGDAYDDEKRRIQDLYDNPVSGLLAKQRAQAQSASDEYARRKLAVGDAYDTEMRAIHATYDDQVTGSIPATRRALAAYQDTVGPRKAAIDDAYQHEQRAIADTYTNELTGLIPLQRRAEADAQDKYNKMAGAVRASAESQKESIKHAYRADDGKSGILDQIDESKRLLDEQLGKEEQRWRDYKEGLTGKDGTITKTWEDAQKAVNAYFDLIERRRSAATAPSGGGTGPNPYGNQPTGQFWTIPGTQTRVELGSNPGTVAPGAQIPNPPSADVEAFIRQAAPQYHVPAEDALRVWGGEGKSGYVGDAGTSFGPYQLHVGGGLGDDFQRTYKEDIRDPSTWRDQVMYTLGYVQLHGWNNQWHGAPADLVNKHYAAGGWIDRPSLILDEQTYRPYARAGEGGRPEWIGPVANGPGNTNAQPQTLHIPVTLGGHLLADIWVEGKEQANGQGRYSDRSPKGRARTGGAPW